MTINKSLLEKNGREEKHIDEIDIAKGIGIFLVVLGHCFPDVSAERGVSVPLFRTVHDVEYTFHMPLMFFLAGFLSQLVLKAREGKDKIQFIKDRFVRLTARKKSTGYACGATEGSTE